MGKQDPPAAPTPPSAAEISAANVETATAMQELQRAMQFGGEVLKDGYVLEELDVPEGSKPVYSTQEIRTTMPKFIMDAKKNAPRLKVGTDGKIESQWVGKDNPDTFAKEGNYVGMNWWEAVEQQNKGHEEAVKNRIPSNLWTHEHGGAGSQYGTTTVETLSGYEGGDGEFTPSSRYFKIDDKGNRTEVRRDEALMSDFTGMSDTDLARKQWEFEKETSPERTEFFLDQLEQYGPEAAKLGRTVLESTDPTGFAARELLGNLAQAYQPADVPAAPEMQEIGEVAAAERIAAPPTLSEVAYTPEYQRAGELGDLGRVQAAPQFAELGTTGPTLEGAAEMAALERTQAAPSLERLQDIPEMQADPTSLAGRRFAEQQFIDRAQTGRTSQLMAEEARRVARGRAAATGNIFGGGAVIEEARAVRQAEDAGQRQALSDLIGFLQSGQSAGDYESRLAQQNLANRLMGIQQRTGAEQAEFGMGQEVTGQRNVAAMQERADELSAMGQRNQAEQQEFQNLQAAIDQANQVRAQQFGVDMQAQEFNTQQRMRERADELSAMAQRNQAEESEYQNLLQGLQQQQNVRTAGFGMQQQAVGQRNQAAEADFAKQQSALAQRNQARQQSFANAMQRTATQQQMQQQQMANLQSFSGLTPVSQQFGGMAGAQQGMQATFNPIQYQPTSAQALLQGQQQLQSSLFGTEANIWSQQAQMANQPSAFGQVLGTAAGAFAGGFGEMAGAKAAKNWLKPPPCHVAREVYGEDNPKWVQFFYWKELEGPEWFKNLYNKHSERVASFIRNKPALKDIVRSWMDSKIQG